MRMKSNCLGRDQCITYIRYPAFGKLPQYAFPGICRTLSVHLKQHFQYFRIFQFGVGRRNPEKLLSSPIFAPGHPDHAMAQIHLNSLLQASPRRTFDIGTDVWTSLAMPPYTLAWIAHIMLV